MCMKERKWKSKAPVAPDALQVLRNSVDEEVKKHIQAAFTAFKDAQKKALTVEIAPYKIASFISNMESRLSDLEDATGESWTDPTEPPAKDTWGEEEEDND